MSIIPEKQENQKQVLTLNELSKRKVVEHNSLITSIAKMDKTPLKMFELAVSCINTEEPPKDNIVYLSKRDLFAFFKVSDNDKHVSCINTEEPPKDNIVYLSKRDLFAFFKVSDNDKHSRFKQAFEKMQKQAFFQIKEEQGKGFKFKSIVPIPYVEWTDYNDEVKIEFHREIFFKSKKNKERVLNSKALCLSLT